MSVGTEKKTVVMTEKAIAIAKSSDKLTRVKGGGDAAGASCNSTKGPVATTKEREKIREEATTATAVKKQ